MEGKRGMKNEGAENGKKTERKGEKEARVIRVSKKK